jgi:hypothetical protein
MMAGGRGRCSLGLVDIDLLSLLLTISPAQLCQFAAPANPMALDSLLPHIT